MEIEGWNVTIVYEKDKRNHSQRWIFSNPIETDTDFDDVPDFQEFTNSIIVIMFIH